MPVTQVSGTTGERALRERDALPAWRPMLRDHSLPLENGNAGSHKTAILKAIRINSDYGRVSAMPWTRATSSRRQASSKRIRGG